MLFVYGEQDKSLLGWWHSGRCWRVEVAATVAAVMVATMTATGAGTTAFAAAPGAMLAEFRHAAGFLQLLFLFGRKQGFNFRLNRFVMCSELFANSDKFGLGFIIHVGAALHLLTHGEHLLHERATFGARLLHYLLELFLLLRIENRFKLGEALPAAAMAAVFATAGSALTGTIYGGARSAVSRAG